MHDLGIREPEDMHRRLFGAMQWWHSTQDEIPLALQGRVMHGGIKEWQISPIMEFHI